MQTDSNSRKVKRTPVILNSPRKPAGAHFKVLQWNVLADGLAQNGDFCKVPPSCLEWEYRKPLLLQEITEADADIICLQELNHFEELRQALAELGYEGAFRAKHASPALKYEFPPDGMAVFYRRQRFAAAGAGAVEGRSFLDGATGREQSQGFLQILLTDLLVGRELLVVTTHLKAKDGPECEELRYQQARQLLHHVEDTVRKLQHQQNGTGSSGGGGGNGTGNNGVGDAASTVAAAAAGGGGGGSGNGSGGEGSGSGASSGTAAGYGGNGVSGAGGAGGLYGSGGSAVPVVVTGDFNTMPGSKTCETFRRHPLGLLSLWEQRPLDATLSSGSGSDQEAWPATAAAAPPPPPPPQSQAALSPGRPQAPPPSQPAAKPQPQDNDRCACGLQGNADCEAAAAASASAAAQPGAAAGGGRASARPWLGGEGASGALADSAEGWDGGLGSCWRPGREFSTWKFRVKGESKRISDYIWFSGGGPLRPLQRWRMLTEEEIGPGALPSLSYASDHVSLCCEFEWDVAADMEWAPPAAAEQDWG